MTAHPPNDGNSQCANLLAGGCSVDDDNVQCGDPRDGGAKEMLVGDGYLADGGVANRVQDIAEPPPPQASIPRVPEVIQRAQEGAAHYLISEYLRIFHTESTLPTVEEFLISSYSISRTLTSLEALGAAWERLSQQIKTILEQLEAEQSLVTRLGISDLDSQIDKETNMLVDLWSLQDALLIKRSASIASHDSFRTRIRRIDARVKQIKEEKTKLLSERCTVISNMQGCEGSLGNIESSILEGNTRLIDKFEAQLASLKTEHDAKEIERGELASSIEG